MSSPLKSLGTRLRQVPKISFTKGTISNMENDITKREGMNIPKLEKKSHYIWRFLCEEETLSKEIDQLFDKLYWRVRERAEGYDRIGSADEDYFQIIDQELLDEDGLQRRNWELVKALTHVREISKVIEAYRRSPEHSKTLKGKDSNAEKRMEIARAS
tara:strand:+ start:1659 stop:2132 length:474 start_codon:yes stop_codon:yes gene_type:complete